jgi:hypothetical protein
MWLLSLVTRIQVFDSKLLPAMEALRKRIEKMNIDSEVNSTALTL